MPPDSGPGIPGWFVALAVLALLAGVGALIWRISVARSMARDAGLDPDTATKVTLLGGDGVDTTYLASVVAAGHRAQDPAAAAPPKTAADRLQELQAMKDEGLITEAEYEAQRQRILGSM